MVKRPAGLRLGRVTVGCLTLVVLVAVLAYVGNAVGQVYWRFYRFQDAFTQQIKFAASTPDDTIITRLRTQADSLDLPVEAQRIHLRRTNRAISIWSQYADSIVLPGYGREVDFTAHAEKSF
ncbi:MAG TPA: hypothetical protein VN607_00660 [Gemmatimonadaceae bacterium]|nr:hypothetical protein [Gemmatimonadaceae bacterium]